MKTGPMGVFVLLSAACLAALPVIGAWYAGMELVAPLVWRFRRLRQGAQAPALLLPSPSGALELSREKSVRTLINEATGNFPKTAVQDFVTEHNGQTVYVRTQARFVDGQGHPVGIPCTLEEQNRTRLVVVTWMVLDLRQSLSPRVILHIELGRQERDFGDDDLVAALLNGATKKGLGKGDRIFISDGFVVLESPFLLADRGSDQGKAAMSAIAGLSARLESGLGQDGRPRVDALLRQNLEEDLSVRVRAAAADRLLRNHPSLADWAAAKALSDSAPEVRFAAARHLGQEGLDFIVQVIFSDEKITDGLRQRALRFSIREFPIEQVLPLLERSLEEGPDTLRLIAVRQAGELRLKPAIPWIAKSMVYMKEPEAIAAACEALARLEATSAEGVLIELLFRPEPVVIKAAVEALAPIGTVASVASLSKLAETTADREIRLSANTTIPMVQLRGASPAIGALSLAGEDEGGHLALSQKAQAPHCNEAESKLQPPSGGGQTERS